MEGKAQRGFLSYDGHFDLGRVSSDDTSNLQLREYTVQQTAFLDLLFDIIFHAVLNSPWA
jgi:hypothetical protein